MKICKYCKKPISDNDVWNPDSKGNGYHHACLCEMEFMSRDKKIYNKGRADILDKIKRTRKEIENEVKFWSEPGKYDAMSTVNARKAKAQSYKHCLELIDELIAESEEK